MTYCYKCRGQRTYLGAGCVRHDCGVCKGTGYLIVAETVIDEVIEEVKAVFKGNMFTLVLPEDPKVTPRQVVESDFEKINMTTISEVVPKKVKRKYTRKAKNVLRGT